jgi:hypothetical protein
MINMMTYIVRKDAINEVIFDSPPILARLLGLNVMSSTKLLEGGPLYCNKSGSGELTTI